MRSAQTATWPVWKRPPAKCTGSTTCRADLGGQPGEWAYAESPLVDGDLVVCTPGGADATLAALNKLTGEIVWRSAVPGGDAAGYASMIIVQCDGVKQYVQFLSKGLVGVDAATGKFLWRYDRTATGPANIPTPVARDAFVYSGGARCGGGLVQLSANQGQVSAEEVYFDPGLPNGIGGFVQLGDCLYGAISTGMVCIDFQTGKTRWTNRGLGAGALCFADGKLYIHGENGDVGLIEAAPEAYRELGRFTPSDGPNRGKSKAWTYPVVTDGRLYIRDLNSLWCFDVKAPSDLGRGVGYAVCCGTRTITRHEHDYEHEHGEKASTRRSGTGRKTVTWGDKDTATRHRSLWGWVVVTLCLGAVHYGRSGFDRNCENQCAAAPLGSFDEEAMSCIAVDAPQTVLAPYVWKRSGAGVASRVEATMPGAYIRWSFGGSRSIRLLVDGTANNGCPAATMPVVDYSVDGGVFQSVQLTKTGEVYAIAMAEGLDASTEHRVDVCFRAACLGPERMAGVDRPSADRGDRAGSGRIATHEMKGIGTPMRE